MEQNKIVETFETSLIANIWVERNNVIPFLLACIITIAVQFSLIKFFELLLGSFLFTGIIFLGFVGIAAHIQYHFHFEKNRKVHLFADRIIISISSEVFAQLFKKDIVKIILFDKLKSESKSGGYNAWPTYLDPFYYLIVIGKNQERIILTCLLDIRLKKKIAAWYGQELEHKYQFFPFPANGERMRSAK